MGLNVLIMECCGLRKADFKVIAVICHERKHYAEKPGEFLPILGQLRKLHKKGFVHGDLRGFNIVFKKESR